MALKNVLVYVDDHPNAEARIAAAAELAAAHGGHLTGLYVVAPVLIPSYIEAQLPDEVLETQRRREAERAVAAHRVFERCAGQSDLGDRTEWRAVRGDPTDVVAAHARTSDLVVIGQIDHEFEYDGPVVAPDDLVFEAGRPVLVIPRVGRYPRLGRRVLVGWNESREAARAVGDAMPLLEKADSVVVLAMNPLPAVPGLSEEPGFEMARHLAHHGIKAEASHFVGESREVGDTLLNQASDLSCDLIVIGAYGHSRLRAMILGSLTSFVIEHMTVPVLMSH